MARNDEVFALMQAAIANDRERIKSICRMIAANEKPNSTLKRQIHTLLERSFSLYNADSSLIPVELKGLVLHVEPDKALSDVVLSDDNSAHLAEFMNERVHIDTLRSFNLKPANKLLLSGPPGNGKTSLAGAIAKELALPFFVLDFSKVISSMLGESGAKIAKVFRGVSGMPCVLFIDEMETVLSERAGQASKSEVGEIARIVSTLLQEIDRMPEQVILIGATNHIEMLDRAVVRRFDHHWKLEQPGEDVKAKWIANFAKTVPGIPVSTFDIDTANLSISDLEQQVKVLCKRWALKTVAA